MKWLWLFAGVWFAGSKLPLARYYVRLTSRKLAGSVRLALVTDTHSSRFGSDQQDLVTLIREASPDAILLAGDIYDDVRDNKRTRRLLAKLAAMGPCFYSSGNHDQNSPDYSGIRQELKKFGISYLDGISEDLTIRGQMITLSGIADPQRNYRSFHSQLKRLPQRDNYHVVLSHRPHYVKKYRATQADLIVSGHAHGGQWRLGPIGVYSPGQGLFPKYTKGHYRLGRTDLVVSPGLMRNYLPRFFNPPTLVIIDIQGEQ